ncbi:MAG: hypothetical protein RL015_1398 [Verrucomicrobiota bacterium]|jgi:hypothetical protein
MKSPLTLFIALALLALPAQAEKLEQWLKLLPKNTLGFLAIKSAPELMADWEKSGYGKMLADEEIKKWTAPMYQNGEPIWDKTLKEGTGEGLEANLKRIQGSVIITVAADSVKDMQDVHDNDPVFVLMDVGDQQAKFEEVLTKDIEENLQKEPTLKKLVKDVAGVPLHVLAVSEDEDAKWRRAYAFVDGVLVLGDKPALLEYIIAALKTGTADASDVVPGHLTRHAQFSEGTADVSFYANGEVLMKWLEESLTELMKNGKSQMPIDPKAIFDALGTKEFQSLGFSMDLSDTQSRIDIALLHPEKPTGLISLLRGNQTEVNLPAFVPVDALSAQVMRQSLEAVYDGLLGMVNKLGPMAMMATMQISQVEQQMGFKIKEDLFGSLDDEYVQANDGTAVASSQVMAIKVKDRAKLVGALDGLKRFVGQGFGAAFDESEYLGYTINTFKASQATAAGAASTEVAYCLTEDYLLFSTGKQDLLKKILSRMKDPSGPSIWDSARTQELIAMLPKGYVGVGVSDASKQLLTVIDALTALQEKTASKKKAPVLNKKGPSKGPKAGAAADESEVNGPASWFDADAQPSEAMFKKYLGTEVGGNYVHPDAIHFRTLSKPVE